MDKDSANVFVVFRLDALHRGLEAVGVYTHEDEAEAHRERVELDRSAVVVPMSMESALALLREEGRHDMSVVVQQRLDRLTERVGELSAVVAAQRAA